MNTRYNFYIVVNGQEHKMIPEEHVTTEGEVYKTISNLKDIESISLVTADGLLLAINGIQYKDVYFIARKEEIK